MTRNNLGTIILISVITFFLISWIDNKDFILAILALSYIIMWSFIYKVSIREENKNKNNS